MPTYTFACSECSRSVDQWKHMDDYNKDIPSCCDKEMRRVFTPPQIASDIQPYKSTIDGSRIANRQQHKEHLKRHNCFEIGNDYQHMLNRKKEIRGDFNVQRELKSAVQEVLSKAE